MDIKCKIIIHEAQMAQKIALCASMKLALHAHEAWFMWYTCVIIIGFIFQTCPVNILIVRGHVFMLSSTNVLLFL